MWDSTWMMQDVPAAADAVAWCDRVGFIFPYNVGRIPDLLADGALVLEVENGYVKNVEGPASLAAIIRIDAALWEGYNGP